MDGDDSRHSLGGDEMSGGNRAVKRTKMEADSEDSYQPLGGRAHGPQDAALLNFATAADELDLTLKRQKVPRDPMSHRIIEKRRRDRMNNCLADLSRLIPSSYHKQGQGRIEKTEIIEMAIKHINMLQKRLDEAETSLTKAKEEPVAPLPSAPDRHHSHGGHSGQGHRNQGQGYGGQCCSTKFYLGFKEAGDEVMRFLVEVQSISAVDPFCKKIMKHMEKASKKFITDPFQTCSSYGERESFRPSTKSEMAHQNRMDKQNHGTGYPGSLPSLCDDKMDAHPAGQAYMSRSAFYEPGRMGSGGADEPAYHESERGRRDKHLRSLLADQQHSSNAAAGSLQPETGSSGAVPSFSYSSHLSGSGGEAHEHAGSSGYASDLSNMDKNSNSNYNPARDNVYKFKHTITKRFSQEGHHHPHHAVGGPRQPSDSSSSTSSRDLEDDHRGFNKSWKGHKGTPASGTDDSGLGYRGDDGDAAGGVPSGTPDSSLASEDSRARPRALGAPGVKAAISPDLSSAGDDRERDRSSFILPGFILHPSGTHYMPISVQNTNVQGLLDLPSDQGGGPPVFHPISIPVHFRRPVI